MNDFKLQTTQSNSFLFQIEIPLDLIQALHGISLFKIQLIKIIHLKSFDIFPVSIWNISAIDSTSFMVPRISKGHVDIRFQYIDIL
jgi:hypothetical protein